MEREENWGGGYSTKRRMTWQEAKDAYEGWLAKRRTAKHFTFGNKNTFLEYDEENNTYDIRLYSTVVVKIWPGDIYQVFMGGWNTVTTKDRIATFSPIHVYNDRKMGATVTVNKWKNSIGVPDFGPETIKFYEGIKVNANRDLIQEER
jgi:hypothetical protein